MDSTADFVFLLGLTCLLLHELDAIQQREWRFFFARVPVSDQTAYRVFTAIHAPALVLILWNLQSTALQTGLDVFLLFHLGLHGALRNHPLITFNNAFSWLWIGGGAAFGTLHLLLTA